MNNCYEDLGPVNLEDCDLGGVKFLDTGGTNGWLAQNMPKWVQVFVKTLPIKGVVTLTTLRMLPAGQGIPPHIDPVRRQSDKLCEHRYHIPLVTHRDVIMHWPVEGIRLHMETGHLYEVNHNTKVHEVVNRAPLNRVHLCIDTVEVMPTCS